MSKVRKKWNKLDKSDKVAVFFIILMQIAFVGAFIFAIYEGAWLPAFLSVIALFVIWLPSILERNLLVRFPLEFDFLLNIFIYSSIFLGEIRGFYTRFWCWDVVLHTMSGVALGFIGFLILFSLYRGKRLSIKPSLLSLFSFCFALALGVIWEIFEFSMDNIFGFNMQKNGLTDTMWDLIVNTGGAFLVSLSGYFYMKYKWKGIGIFQHYLDVYFSDDK